MYYSRATHLKKHTKGGKLKAQKIPPYFLAVFIDRPSIKDFEQAKQKQAKRLDKLRQKIRVVKLVEHLGQTVGPSKAISKASRQLGVCQRTLRRWWRQYIDGNGSISGLQEKSRMPHRIHYRVHPLIQFFVLFVRMYLGWGARRIEAEFRARGISTISHQTIHKIISKNALRPLIKPKRKIKRYQRPYPDSLWHIDIKGPFWIKGVGKTYIIGLVDDCSRYIIAARIYPSRKMENAISFLNANITLWGKPLDLMSDNDTAFCHWAQGVINQFQRLLQDYDINHLRTRVNSPETNGKIERFWRTLEEELLSKEVFLTLQEAQERLNAYIDNYNHHRLHKGIDYNAPSSLYLNEDFKDRGFTNIWGLEGISDWLNEQLFSIIEASLENTGSNLSEEVQPTIDKCKLILHLRHCKKSS